MNQALRRFKEDRPEEYQEYRGYQRKYWKLNLMFFGACAVALGIVLGCFFLWNLIVALLFAVIALAALFWLYRTQSHARSCLRLSMAIMQLTFDDPTEVSTELKEELKDLFSQD